MKRFEYHYMFKHDESPINVMIWLDSYKEAVKRFPIEMMRYHTYYGIKRTGRKFRSPSLTMKIKLYHLLKRLI